MAAERLRILHTESSTGWGGQEIRILTEAEGMLARGHSVSLVTPDSATIHEAARQRGIPVIPLPIGRKSVAGLAAMTRLLAAHRGLFDVINTHSSTDAWLTALALVPLPLAPPMVRTRHVSTAVANNRTSRWLYRSASAHIVTTGEALRLQLARQNGFALERMTSVRTGIELSVFKPRNKESCRRELGIDARPAVGILATLRDWKGHDYLVDAWSGLRERFPEWQLLVIGDGPQRTRLEQRVRTLGIADSVGFVGNQENPALWLSSLDLFTLPSYGDEGVPQGIMQAMACGLAVVATPVGAIEEAVQRDQTGLIVETRNSVALADAMCRLMGDEALRRSMGQAGSRYARENFGLVSMLDKMEAVFRAVVTATKEKRGDTRRAR